MLVVGLISRLLRRRIWDTPSKVGLIEILIELFLSSLLTKETTINL